MYHWVVADPHGNACTLGALIYGRIGVERISRLTILGDMCDRGPRSKAVLNILLGIKKNGRIEVNAIKGNHEDLLLKTLEDPSYLPLWKRNGGEATLDSFCVKSPSEIPLEYIAFIESSTIMEITPTHVIVHAGLDFTLPDPINDTSDDDKMWIRRYTYNSEALGGKKLVTGHSPKPVCEIIESLATDHITLDNGCFRTGTEGMGNLVAYCLDNGEIIFQRNIDQVAKVAYQSLSLPRASFPAVSV